MWAGGLQVAQGLQAFADGFDFLGRQGVDVSLNDSPLVMGDQVSQDVHRELGDGVEARALDDLLQLLVKRTRDLQGDRSVCTGLFFHPTTPEIPIIVSGTRKSPAV